MSKHSTPLTRKIRRTAWSYADRVLMGAGGLLSAGLYVFACSL